MLCDIFKQPIHYQIDGKIQKSIFFAEMNPTTSYVQISFRKANEYHHCQYIIALTIAINQLHVKSQQLIFLSNFGIFCVIEFI